MLPSVSCLWFHFTQHGNTGHTHKLSDDQEILTLGRGTLRDLSSMDLRGNPSPDGLFRTDGEGNHMTWYLVKPQVSGGMHLFSATPRLEDLFSAYEAIFILAEADPTFAKAQEDMTIYYD